MAGISVGTFVAPLLDNLSNLLKDSVPKLIGWGVADKVKKWEDDFKMIRAVVADAETKQFSDEAVQIWLGQLKDVAYDMEDVLELLDIRGPENELQTIIQKILQCSCLDFMKENLSIEEKVADITKRLEDIRNQNTTFQRLRQLVGMQQQTLQTEAFRSQRETTSAVSKVFGRDDMKQEIIKRLFKGNHDDQSNTNYVMISIVGAGGIGKTTLAQLVYNDEQVKKMKFDFKAWVCVSDAFDVRRITTSIIRDHDTTAAAVENNNLQEAQKKLMDMLMNKKFLIVLDDVWNEIYAKWEKLQIPFEQAAKGSRVIMTTRNVGIARMMNTNTNHDNIFHLQGLSDDACWDIVQQHANNITDLAEMQADIIRKCNGSPLAAKILGGLLKTKDTSREWHQILNNDLSTENENIALPILRLSYNHLPSHLKRVFAYCSVFPKDSAFEEMEVVLLWMAQGFLPDGQSESMETTGQHYFHELVRRSLLEVHPRHEKEFIMHDLIHDLALQAAGDICHEMDTRNINNRARHVIRIDNGATSLESALPMTPQLRTLVCSQYDVSSIEKFSCLRTLILDKIEVLPECIGDLKLLRLLRLRAGRIEKLPISITSLSNLQTLWVERCYDLEEVPNIGSLKKLRHLHIVRASLEMPLGIENLTNLRSLGRFVLGNGQGSRVKDLKNLNYLQGELRISGVEKVSNSGEANEAQLHKKCGLDELYLDWGTCEEQVDDNTLGDVLEQLKPPTSIKACNLVGYMGTKLPDWLGDPSFTNMVAIKLTMLEKCEGLPPLGQLPKLERLKIGSMKSIRRVGAEFYGDCRWSNAFPALKHLKFGEMPSWEKWVHPPVEEGKAFAELEGLEIMGDCRLLEGKLPRHLPHLKTLKISKCKDMSISLASLPSVVDLVVSDCEKIIITSGASCELAYLSKLEISGCPNLVFCSPGRMHLPVLNDIEIFNSENLESLPSQMHTFNSLQRLKIYGCPKLQCIPEGGLPINLKELVISRAKINGAAQGSWGRLQKLRLSFVESKEDISLPSTLCEIDIRYIQNLKNLRVGNCTNLTTLEVSDCSDLETLVGNFPSLQRLEIDDCPKLQCIPEGGLPINLKELVISRAKINGAAQESWGRLQKLRLSYVESEEDISLPSSLCEIDIRDIPNLKNLRVGNCTNLTTPEVSDCSDLETLVGNFPSLQRLEIDDCPNLKNLNVGNCTNLTKLSLRECPKLQSLPQGFLDSLEDLTLWDVGSSTDAVERIPGPDLELPSSMRSLDIGGFQNLKSINYSALPNLAYCLRISHCPKFEFFDDNPVELHRLHFLEGLSLWNLGSSTDAVKRIPGPHLDLPSSLSFLSIDGFRNLKSISCSALPNLKYLHIMRCPKFEFFWDNAYALPPQLRVVFFQCELVTQHLRRDPDGRIDVDDHQYSLP